MVFSSESRQRISRMFPLLTALLRGRSQRMKRKNHEFSLFAGVESLETRTMLDASSPSALFAQQFVEVSISDADESANSSQAASFESASETQISWSQIPDASGYELLIYSTSQGREVLNLDSLGAATFQPASLSGPDSFQMFVRATDSSGQNTLWSNPVYFDVTLPSSSAIPASPSFLTATGHSIPALEWTTSIDASRYDLLIYSVSAGQEVVHETGLNGGSFAATSLTGAADDYQAFVRASNSQGQSSDWSQPALFSVSGESQIPQAPVLTGVTDSTPPDLTWNGVAGANSYEILVYSLAQGREVLRDIQTGSTSYKLNSLAGQTDSFQVFVRANNVQGISSLWGTPMEFEMSSESAFPQSPAITITPSTAQPRFEWSSVNNAESYEIQVYNVTAGSLVMRQSHFQSTSFDVSSLTASPDNYQAFVRPYDVVGTPGDWSTATNFEIVELPTDPEPLPTPDPDPIPNPDPTPDPVPDPLPDPDPIPNPDPLPNPIPNPDPEEFPPGNPDDTQQASMDAFFGSLDLFHGTDRTGKDGPTSSIGLPLTLLNQEYMNALPSSNYNMQIDSSHKVLVHTQADSSSSTIWRDSLTALGGVAEGEPLELEGDFWVPIGHLDDLARTSWLVEADPVLSPPTNVDWSIALIKGSNPAQVSADVGLPTMTPTGLFDDTYFFSLASVSDPSDVVSKLRSHNSVLFFDPLVDRQLFTKAIPNDEFFNLQWSLLNTGQTFGTPGMDANVVNVWNEYRGAGVTIAVVDDGFDTTHPDLAPNYDATLDWDFNFNDPDPTPFVRDSHGTSVGGVIAGRGFNGIGISGSAPEATLTGIRLLAVPFNSFVEAAAIAHRPQDIDISNNSWGAPDNGTYSPSGSLIKVALQRGVIDGRGGLGNIFTWAGGNGLGVNDDSNYDGYANSRYVIAIGAVDDFGNQTSYSEPGANLLVSAYSSNNDIGIFTTDLEGIAGAALGDYDPNFGGTSSATPLVSGVIALMLNANPSLGWRDVQHILVQSSRRVDPFDAGWIENSAGFTHNPKYGFGAIDATAAVALAKTWVNVAPEVAGTTNEILVERIVPDNNTLGVASIINVNHDITIETVEVIFNATHTFRGDLQVELISPSGTSSFLADARGADGGNDISSFSFTSKQFWGENSQGEWQLWVRDLQDGDEGVFESWELNVYGTGTAAGPTPDGWDNGLPF